jgi:hypothetical protein
MANNFDDKKQKTLKGFFNKIITFVSNIFSKNDDITFIDNKPKFDEMPICDRMVAPFAPKVNEWRQTRYFRRDNSKGCQKGKRALFNRNKTKSQN